LQPLLDGASDNSVAEIMDSEDPLFILYTSGSTGKPKEWFTPPLVIWFIPLILLKMFSIMKKTISFGVQLILVTGHSYILYGLIERSNNSDLRVPSYPDFSRFGKLSKT
jgi:acetyl-CoA synthetase